VIRFEPSEKPDGFVERVEVRGDQWLVANASGRPPPYWLEFRSYLADAFQSLCAYSAMYEPVGTVDHFVSCDEDRAQAYSWSNYRFAAAWINSSKSSLKSHQIVDPFDVTNEWFQLLLPSLQLVLTDHVPVEWRENAQRMLDRLHLAHDERVIRQRRAWYEMYQQGQITLEGLMRKAPLIAMAVQRQEAD
jgi:hypothetical protein